MSLRPVTRGQTTVDKIVITAGLQAGERVITEGADRLKDGSRVVLAGDSPRAAGPDAGDGPGSRGKRQRPDGMPGATTPASGSAGAGAVPAVPETPAPTASSPRRRRASAAEGA